MDNTDRHDWLSTFKSAAATGTAWVSGAAGRRTQPLTGFGRCIALKTLSRPKDIRPLNLIRPRDEEPRNELNAALRPAFTTWLRIVPTFSHWQVHHVDRPPGEQIQPAAFSPGADQSIAHLPTRVAPRVAVHRVEIPRAAVDDFLVCVVRRMAYGWSYRPAVFILDSWRDRLHASRRQQSRTR